MIENWKDVQIVPEFCDQGVDCYRLEGGHFLNEYYICLLYTSRCV